jgi:hypothetical protein
MAGSPNDTHRGLDNRFRYRLDLRLDVLDRGLLGRERRLMPDHRPDFKGNPEHKTCSVCGMECEQQGDWLICPDPNCPWHGMIQFVARGREP